MPLDFTSGDHKILRSVLNYRPKRLDPQKIQALPKNVHLLPRSPSPIDAPRQRTRPHHRMPDLADRHNLVKCAHHMEIKVVAHAHPIHHHPRHHYLRVYLDLPSQHPGPAHEIQRGHLGIHMGDDQVVKEYDHRGVMVREEHLIPSQPVLAGLLGLLEIVHHEHPHNGGHLISDRGFQNANQIHYDQNSQISALYRPHRAVGGNHDQPAHNLHLDDRAHNIPNAGQCI